MRDSNKHFGRPQGRVGLDVHTAPTTMRNARHFGPKLARCGHAHQLIALERVYRTVFRLPDASMCEPYGHHLVQSPSGSSSKDGIATPHLLFYHGAAGFGGLDHTLNRCGMRIRRGRLWSVPPRPKNPSLDEEAAFAAGGLSRRGEEVEVFATEATALPAKVVGCGKIGPIPSQHDLEPRIAHDVVRILTWLLLRLGILPGQQRGQRGTDAHGSAGVCELQRAPARHQAHPMSRPGDADTPEAAGSGSEAHRVRDA
eukprot:7385961-Prymnesium_polylepis.1